MRYYDKGKKWSGTSLDCNLDGPREITSLLVDFFDGGSAARAAAGSSAAGSGEATRHTAGHSSATTLLIQLGDDGSADALQLLLVMLELFLLGRLIAIEPFNDLIALVVDLLSIIFADLLLKPTRLLLFNEKETFKMLP